MLKSFLGVAFSAAMVATNACAAPGPKLVAAAQKEGEIVWYSTAPLEATRVLSNAFQSKYGIRLSMFRGGTFEVYQRVSAEQQARRPIADVVHGSYVPGFVTLARNGLLQPYESPERASYPDYAKDRDGYWTAVAVFTLPTGESASGKMSAMGQIIPANQLRYDLRSLTNSYVENVTLLRVTNPALCYA